MHIKAKQMSKINKCMIKVNESKINRIINVILKSFNHLKKKTMKTERSNRIFFLSLQFCSNLDNFLNSLVFFVCLFFFALQCPLMFELYHTYLEHSKLDERTNTQK